jgi:single-strand DNA-binding protein
MLKMQIIGNLGKDCVVNNVNGKTVINFTVAHTEKFKDSQGVNQERTTWVDCAWWTDRTTIAQYLSKGAKVWVDGSPEVRSFTRNDGTSGAVLAMRVRELQLIGSKADANTGNGNASGGGYSSSAPVQNTTPPPSASADIEDPNDDLPF